MAVLGCLKCRYLLVVQEEDEEDDICALGQCLRYPPTAGQAEGSRAGYHAFGHYPTFRMDAVVGCGEYEIDDGN